MPATVGEIQRSGRGNLLHSGSPHCIPFEWLLPGASAGAAIGGATAAGRVSGYTIVGRPIVGTHERLLKSMTLR